MPAIPQYQQQTRATGPLGPGPLDRGLGAVGQAAQIIADNGERMQIADDATDAGRALAGLRSKTTQAFLDAQEQAAPDASGFKGSVLKDFDTSVTDTMKATRSKRAAQLVRDQSLQLRTELDEKASVWEASRRQAYRSDTITESANQMRSTLEADPDQWQRALAEQLASINAIGLDPERRLALQRQTEASFAEGAATGYAKRDPVTALATLGNPASGNRVFDSLSPEARARVDRYARAQIVEQNVAGVLGKYESGGPTSGVKALADALNGVPPELRDDVRARVNGAVSQLRQQRSEEHANEITGVVRDLASGTAGAQTREKVEQLYSVGALSPEQRASWQGQIDESVIRAAKNNAASDEIRAALASGLPLDPSDPDHRKALSAAFASDTGTLPTGSPEWQATAQVYAQHARMLPDQALAWTRQAMRSPDNALAANAAQFAGAVQASAPDAMSGFDDKTKAFAGTVNSMIEAGTNPARAVEVARANVLEAKPELIKARKESYSGQFAKGSDSALDSLIDKDFDTSIFSAQPTATSDLKLNFAAQAQRYYEHVGDINLARDLAWNDLKRVYGPSKVNGTSMIMAMPPEKFGVRPEDVRADIAALLAGKHELPANPEGLRAKGNINLENRPRVTNPDGSVSTVRTISIGTDQGEVLIPTVSDDGRLLSNGDAIALYRKTGKNFGVFDSIEHATQFAQALHLQQQAQLYGPNPQADGSTADEILVVPDSLTMRAVNDALDGRSVRPSYKLVGKSGDLVTDKHGVPIRYTVPSGEELAQRLRDAQGAAEAEARRNVDQARFDRKDVQFLRDLRSRGELR